MESTIQIRPAGNADGPAVRELVYAALREHGFTPDPDDTDADLADLDASYGSRGGTFEVLVDSSGHIVGTVGLYRLDDERCELRKMYLAPEHRGRGLGKRLLQHAIDRARELGFRRIELETAARLEAAQHLYEAFGFRRFTPQQMPGRCDLAYFLELS